MSHDSPHKILLIDDSATMCAILRDALIKGGFGPRDGFEPVIARQFEAAINIIEAEEPAAIVTDIFMEGMGGLAGIGLVKERWPSIPILAISGGAQSVTGVSALATARQLGISAYMEKPFDMDVFVGAVRSMIDGTARRQALVIDDSATIRKLITRMLDKENFISHQAASMEEALERPDIVSMDLVIVDIFMPGEGGIEGIQRIRANWPTIPIIAVSAGWDDMSPDDALTAAKKLGADVVLKKPFDEQALGAALSGATG